MKITALDFGGESSGILLASLGQGPVSGQSTPLAAPGLPSPASELDRSRRGDRLLHPSLPVHAPRPIGAAFQALKSPNNVLILFNKNRVAPADAAADRDLAFRLAAVTDVRAQSLEAYKTPARRQAAAALHHGSGRLGPHQQRHLAGHRRRARAYQGADRRRQGQRRRAGAQRRLRPTCRDPTTSSSNISATMRPNASTMCTCSRKTRSARSSGTRST